MVTRNLFADPFEDSLNPSTTFGRRSARRAEENSHDRFLKETHLRIRHDGVQSRGNRVGTTRTHYPYFTNVTCSSETSQRPCVLKLRWPHANPRRSHEQRSPDKKCVKRVVRQVVDRKNQEKKNAWNLSSVFIKNCRIFPNNGLKMG